MKEPYIPLQKSPNFHKRARYHPNRDLFTPFLRSGMLKEPYINGKRDSLFISIKETHSDLRRSCS